MPTPKTPLSSSEGLGGPEAARIVPEDVPGAHLAVAVAKVYSREVVDDCYPRHVPEELRAARGILVVGPLAAFVVWLVLVILCAMVIA